MPQLRCDRCGDSEEDYTNYGVVVFNEYIYKGGANVISNALLATPYVEVLNEANDTYAIVEDRSSSLPSSILRGAKQPGSLQ